MPLMSRMNCGFEEKEGFGIFTFSSDLTNKHEKDLNLLLMRAIHSTERAVLNMCSVARIDAACMKLLQKAYHTSLRLKTPLIVTGLSTKYRSELLSKDDVRRIKMTQQSRVSGKKSIEL